MNKIWKLIEEYRNAGAIHKIRGFNLKEPVSSVVRMKAAASELIELTEQFTLREHVGSIREMGECDYEARHEMADLLIILFDTAQRNKWTLEDVENAMETKLKERFEIPENVTI